MRLHSLVNVNRHGNVHTGQCSGLSAAIIHRYRIVEVHELYHIAQTVVYHQRRILQHVSEIGLTEYVHVTTHFQFVHRTIERSIHVYINLSVHGCLSVLRSIHQLVVAGLHAEVYHHLFQVGEIYCTIDYKRRLTSGIDIELIKYHLAVLHLDFLVVEAETNRHIRHDHQNGIELQATVQDRFRRIAFHGQCTINIPSKVHHSIRDERIDDPQREMLQFEFTCYIFLS